MKRVVVAITIIAMIASLQGVAQKVKKVTYEFPDAMLPVVKEQYIKFCDKGQILYNINCAQCHNTTVKGKQVIPDFTQEQLTEYELRIQNPKHESSIPESTVTTEELGYIVTFLTYKKKNVQGK